jgi:hypothetical protein
VSEPLCFGLSRDFCNRCLLWFLRSRTKVDLNFFYLASFHGEELRVPGAPAILGFAIVEDEGFVAFLKQLLNAIRWGFLAIGPSAFEAGFTVNAIVVCTGKYEVVGQKTFHGLTVFVFVGEEVLADEVQVGHFGLSNG